jgi:hypothetical protein
MKRIFSITVFLLVAFSFKSAFSQGREIKGIFNASTQSVEVGDSCFIPVEHYVNGGFRIYPSPETDSAFNSLYAFLKKNPSVCIAFVAHSDPRPIPITNDTLTARRASRLKERILEYDDIDANRIIAVGMGSKQPRIVTEEIHQQYDFLPVGQVLDMEFCDTITDAQNRNIALGLNRRTVVKIVQK